MHVHDLGLDAKVVLSSCDHFVIIDCLASLIDMIVPPFEAFL